MNTYWKIFLNSRLKFSKKIKVFFNEWSRLRNCTAYVTESKNFLSLEVIILLLLLSIKELDKNLIFCVMFTDTLPHHVSIYVNFSVTMVIFEWMCIHIGKYKNTSLENFCEVKIYAKISIMVFCRIKKYFFCWITQRFSTQWGYKIWTIRLFQFGTLWDFCTWWKNLQSHKWFFTFLTWLIQVRFFGGFCNGYLLHFSHRNFSCISNNFSFIL